MNQVIVTLQQKYLNLGLRFNADKPEIILFNWKGESSFSIALNDVTVRAVDHLVYLGIPIGLSLRDTLSLLLDYLLRHISASYGLIVAAKVWFNRLLLACLFNVVTLPHTLHIAPFWKLFTRTDCLKVRSIFFWFAKLHWLLPWHQNSPLVRKYGTADHKLATSKLFTSVTEGLDLHIHRMIDTPF